MSSGKTNLKSWILGNEIVGFTTIPPWTGSGGAQLLYVPILMPNTSMGQGTPKSIPASINKACFINDKACAPAVSTKISIQNYITVQPDNLTSFARPVFYSGSKIIINVQNNDENHLTLSSKEDNSSYPPP